MTTATREVLQVYVRVGHRVPWQWSTAVQDNSAHSPPELGGDALAQRGLGRSVQSRTVPINKHPLRGHHYVASFHTAIIFCPAYLRYRSLRKTFQLSSPPRRSLTFLKPCDFR